MKNPLPRPVFQALIDALGAQYVSEDDSTVASHSWNAMAGDPGRNLLSEFWPSAVVLPGSTAEVQAVVKLCNQYRIRFRAISTGIFATSGKGEHYVILDLRRMNGLRIDAKNQMAEIEPYATAGQIQAEALKHGLTCHVIGAGPPHSPLASAAAMQGIGVSGATTGVNFRNLLAFEWVTPQGEVTRVGSAGCGAGWFSGEGPGPGFRGMIRGDTGTMGGLGVFTKIGLKLHPWRGPATGLEKTGTFPQLGMKIPEHGRLYHAVWDSWEDAADAAMRFNASRAADFWVRVPPQILGAFLTGTNNEYVDRLAAGTLPEAARDANAISWTVLTVARSAAEATYKAKVMNAILQETRGREIPLGEGEAEIMALNLVSSPYVIRAFRPALGGMSSFGVLDSFKLLPKVMSTAQEMFAQPVKAGHFAKSCNEGIWAWPNEGRYLWAENVPVYDQRDKRAGAAAIRYYISLAERLVRKPIGVNGFLSGPGIDLVGSRLGKANSWMRKVKRHYDPQNLSMAQFYVDPQMPAPMKAWPLARRILMSKIGAPLFRKMTEQMFKAKN